MRRWFIVLAAVFVVYGVAVASARAGDAGDEGRSIAPPTPTTGDEHAAESRSTAPDGSGVEAVDPAQQDPDQDGADEGEDELEALRRAAAEAAAQQQGGGEDEGEEEVVFKSGGLGLQKLNPEISVTGDMLSTWQDGNDDLPTWDTAFRSLGLHFEAYLDPYSRFKAAVPIAPGMGAELGEAYFTRYGFLGNLNLTLGKFRQQFGVVNRWHKHALDTFDFPLALKSIFGGGGLNQIGLSLEANASTGWLQHGLIAQVTTADNGGVFSENLNNDPAILAHYKAYVDLSASTYLQLGGTGLWGWNDQWNTVSGVVDEKEPAAVYGVDLMLLWEPTSKMRYRNLQWRSEGYFADKKIVAPDGSGPDRLRPWGLYSLLQSKVSRTVELGVRYDYYQPEVRQYVSNPDNSIPGPWLSEVDGAYRQAFSGWITWWQSPFVKFRGGYMYEYGDGTGPDVGTFTLQMVFAAGPHKHERY